MITYPTLAYDYSIPCIISLIPFQIYYYKKTIEKFEKKENNNIFKNLYFNYFQKHLQLLILFGFLFFVFSASFLGNLLLKHDLKQKYIIYYYFFFFIVLTLISFIHKTNRNDINLIRS